MGEVEVGSKIRPGDVADLMEWIEKRVGKRSKEPMDLVWLSLVVAELSILFVRENWGYNESVDEAIAGLREHTKEMAKGMYGDFRAVAKGKG